MNNELALIVNDANAPLANDENFDILTAHKGFLQRLQLCTAMSDACKDGLVPVNNYAMAVSSEKFDVIGPAVDVLIITYRNKALDMSDRGNIISVYDMKVVDKKATGEFARIMEQSEVQDSGCMYGPEFLVWVPCLNRFGALFLGAKSHRFEAPSFKALLGKAATLSSHKVGKTRTWFVPDAKPCSTPLSPMPSLDEAKAQIEKFRKEVGTLIETPDGVSATRER